MKVILASLVGGMILAGSTWAETKVLTVGKMDCADCAATVKEKLCGIAKFEKCDVQIIDEKNQLGQVTLVTKGQEKIDMKKVAKIIADEGFELKQ